MKRTPTVAMDTTDLEMTSSLQKYNFPKWMKFGLNFMAPNFDEISSLPPSPSDSQLPPEDNSDCHSSQTSHHWQIPDSAATGPLPSGVDMKPSTHASFFPPSITQQSAEASADTTPSSSPPGSPVLSSRPSDNNSASTHFNSRGISPVQWIFQGFFPFSQSKAEGLSLSVESQQSNNKNVPSVPDNTKVNKQKFSFPLISHKKYNISNFDINALSPTSW